MKVTFRIIFYLLIFIQINGCKTQEMLSGINSSSTGSAGLVVPKVGGGNADLMSGYRINSGPAGSRAGMNISVNGVNINEIKSVASAISMIGLTVTSGYFLNELVGFRKEKVPGYDFKEVTDKYFMGFGVKGKIVPVTISTILVIPVTGTINSLIWSGGY